MRLNESALLKRVVVDDGPDAADDWIGGPGSIAIAERVAATPLPHAA